jgi:hypothetical protein
VDVCPTRLPASCPPEHLVRAGGIGSSDSGKTWLIVSDSISSWRLLFALPGLTGRRMTRYCTQLPLCLRVNSAQQAHRSGTTTASALSVHVELEGTRKQVIEQPFIIHHQYPGDCAAAQLVGTSSHSLARLDSAQFVVSRRSSPKYP